MKYNNSTIENIFRQPMTRLDNSHNWNFADQYFFAAEKELYRDLSKREMIILLESASAIQNEHGLLPLLSDPYMPRDARVGFIYQPTYAITAVSIYAYLKWPEIFEGSLQTFLSAMLESGYEYGIVGHGFEAQETTRRTLMMFCKAGVKEFLVAHGTNFPHFREVIFSYMSRMEQLAQRIDSENIKCMEGFCTDSINPLIKKLVAAWQGKTLPVFVYGTLMQGQRAADMLYDSVYAGKFLLKDYGMYNLGAYPGIRPMNGENVYGELYYINETTRQQLDYYEGNGSLYNRTIVSVCNEHFTLEAEAYVYLGNVDRRDLMRQPWNAKDDDLVWYAGYGSNLSTKRFRCYIEGGMCEENGRSYAGARDKTPARAARNKSYPGHLYFGNKSSSWCGGGVAFYDPNGCSPHATKGWEDAYNSVHMRLYKISRAQLEDVMDQEGRSPNWYGRMICLEVDEDGIPVYTLTSETRRPENAPSKAYSNLIINALKKEFRMGIRDSKGYVKKWQPKAH